jgi:hypothetical protein
MHAVNIITYPRTIYLYAEKCCEFTSLAISARGENPVFQLMHKKDKVSPIVEMTK